MADVWSCSFGPGWQQSSRRIKVDPLPCAEGSNMSDRLKVAFLLLLMFAVAAWSTLYFRAEYTYAKRLRSR